MGLRSQRSDLAAKDSFLFKHRSPGSVVSIEMHCQDQARA